MKRILIAVTLGLAGAVAQAQSGLPATDTRAVPTYESVGLYWSNPGANAVTGCEVKYRRAGDSAWKQGLAMWFDVRNNECRGSVVNLTQDTGYEVQFNLPGVAPMRAATFRTWPNQRPVLRTVTVASGAATLNITQGGSPSGYVVYQGAPGATLDALNASPYNVSINASYVIVRGLVLKGAQQDGIRIAPNVTDVIIEDNEISGWGRQRSGIYGVEHDSAVHAVCSSPTLERVTVQRNEIHDPRYTANSWSDGHPQGPQGVTFTQCGGNHVIRHNEIFSTTGRYYNDIIGGGNNDSTTGFPNADTDIYGNDLSHAWDDAIEAEGGNRNVRVWGNYINQTGTGVASTPTATGPIYMFRNVYNRSRMLEKSPLDQDDRQVMFKAGAYPGFGDGRRYIFHNTMLQATQAGAVYGLGAAGGISGTGAGRLINNTVSRNNIFHNWRTWTAYYDVGAGNDFANDLYNGSAGAAVVSGITGTPIYAAGNGWTNEAGGQYQLAPNSPGYDKGARIANFNDAFSGAGPDVGTHEAGTAAMRFGIAGSAGSAASGTVTPPVPGAAPPMAGEARKRLDFNADAKADLAWKSNAGGYGAWLMNGIAAPAAAAVSGGSGAVLRATGDFDGNGRADLLWRGADGSYRIDLMNGLTVASSATVLAGGSGWDVVAKGDFNGDGKADLLWKDTAGGYGTWLMNGTAAASTGAIAAPGAGWAVAFVADFNGDGKSDVLWRHADGSVMLSIMNGATVSANSGTLLGANTGWTPAFVGDFNGDGKADIVNRHTDGSHGMWLMNGTYIATPALILGAVTGWAVKLVADVSGDGKTDLVWTHTDGSVGAWTMNGVSATSTGVLLGAATGWAPVAAGDLNGDGREDLVWRDTAGTYGTWLMNGLAVSATAQILGPGSGWDVIP